MYVEYMNISTTQCTRQRSNSEFLSLLSNERKTAWTLNKYDEDKLFASLWRDIYLCLYRGRRYVASVMSSLVCNRRSKHLLLREKIISKQMCNVYPTVAKGTY